MKTAVSPGSWPGIVMLMAYGPPSLAPIMSMMAIGCRAASARLLAALSVAPVDTTRWSDDRSYGRPAASAASSAATTGRAKASPTIDIWVTRSRSTSARSSSAS